MSQQAEQVKTGYASIESASEREEIRKFIQDFENKMYDEKKGIRESFQKKNYSSGPVNIASGKCACCGK